LRRLALIIGLGALLAVPFAQARPTVVPLAGFYDCRTPQFTYYSDVLLRTNGTYVHGFVDNSGRRFKRVLGRGVFTRSGSRLTFRSGTLRSMYGIVKTQKRFGLWRHGQRNYSFYCYYTSKN
jgi:hypothetical protein